MKCHADLKAVSHYGMTMLLGDAYGDAISQRPIRDKLLAMGYCPIAGRLFFVSSSPTAANQRQFLKSHGIYPEVSAVAISQQNLSDQMSNIYHKITCDIFSDLRSGALKISCDEPQGSLFFLSNDVSILFVLDSIHVVPKSLKTSKEQRKAFFCVLSGQNARKFQAVFVSSSCRL